jgi:hypothetical protein
MKCRKWHSVGRTQIWDSTRHSITDFLNILCRIEQGAMFTWTPYAPASPQFFCLKHQTKCSAVMVSLNSPNSSGGLEQCGRQVAPGPIMSLLTSRATNGSGVHKIPSDTHLTSHRGFLVGLLCDHPHCTPLVPPSYDPTTPKLFQFSTCSHLSCPIPTHGSASKPSN